MINTTHNNITKDKKTLQELTFKDNFMFAAVMLDADNAKGVLELVLGFPIEHVEVSYEKSMVYNPEYKGVRLDVYAMDENNTHYDIEMQVANEHIAKRSRYYHSQIDMDLLLTGLDYEDLPDSYVIFICDFDPIGRKKYRYTIKEIIAEDSSVPYDDGSHTIFLSTVGTNDGEVPPELVKFLKFTGADLSTSEHDYEDAFVRKLQSSVAKIKSSREMGKRYMLFEEIKKREFKAGKAEGLAEGKAQGKTEGLAEGNLNGARTMLLSLLSVLAPISDSLESKIESIDSLEVLETLIQRAAKAKSIKDFEKELDSI